MISTEAFIAERKALTNLKNLVDRSCEAVGLWQLLCEHDITVITSRMDPVSIAYHCYNTGLFILMFSCHCFVFQAPRDRLRHLRFRDLITVGQEVSRISTCSLEMMMIMVIKMVMRMMTGYSDGYDNDDD